MDDSEGGHRLGRYADGLLSLPGGVVRGVEEVVRVQARGTGPDGLERAGEAAGNLRQALGQGGPRSLPLRLALSTVRAGLGLIEDGLRPDLQASPVEIGFADGSTVVALLPGEAAALIRRDAAIARGALERQARKAAVPLPAPPVEPAAPAALPDGTGDALTSIFRYEKRNGRLRRVPVEPGED
ncbi:hypothetical protein [Methylobacterium organophilum]|uniref:Uncharacterized protein n=1 Tax=Methylobacterium organophilum TaxID=410 RepID=A0ABQ4TBR4_METOR|nr:hypothetical protein [Methylobacterium organophilum]GJE28673.1 hypothetical protein LKMONMHP_3546 [Methylobacterium organophilum]